MMVVVMMMMMMMMVMMMTMVVVIMMMMTMNSDAACNDLWFTEPGNISIANIIIGPGIGEKGIFVHQ